MEYTTLFKPSDTDSGEWPGQPQSQETFFENQGFIKKAFAFNFLLLWHVKVNPRNDLALGSVPVVEVDGDLFWLFFLGGVT